MRLAERGEITEAANQVAAIDARHVSKTFLLDGKNLQVLQDLSLVARQGEFVSLVGPSGCGKSTLLRILAGLSRPDSGEVRVDGEDVTGRPGLTGYMPQNDLLLPWKTVLDNAALPLEIAGRTRRSARHQARQLFPAFGLAGFEGAYPVALSGGMRQRAAFLRTVLTGRDILLLDEPFGALDALTRAGMQEWLLDMRRQLGKTILFVTHDVEEALFLSDRVYVLTPRPGQVRTLIEVPMGAIRPRVETVTSPLFAELKRELLSMLAAPREE